MRVGAGGLGAVHETSVKFHPCCRYMHGVMDLLAAYRTEGGRVEGIQRIDCGVLSAGTGLVGEPLARKRTVSNMVDAQFSMPFGAALSATCGEALGPAFGDEGFGNGLRHGVHLLPDGGVGLAQLRHGQQSLPLRLRPPPGRPGQDNPH